MNEFGNNNPPLALISGASKGLGLVLANFLVARGYSLIINARDPVTLNETREQLKQLGGVVDVVAGDVSDPDHQARLFDVVRPFGELDLLINNASTLGPLPMPTMSGFPLDDLRLVFEINTFAPLALLQGMRPFLAAAQGLVVNISSDAAVGGYEGWGGYGASKAALDLISATLANELGGEDISVISVDPGDMRTKMHQDAFPGEDISDRPLPEETLPFWAWLLGQDAQTISGQRYQAQSELWQVPV